MTLAIPGGTVRTTVIDLVTEVLAANHPVGLDAFPRDLVEAESFAFLGLDSLAGAELTARIEDELGVDVTADLFACHGVDDLVRAIERRSSVTAGPINGRKADGDSAWKLQRMRDDARLPDDIQPGPTVAPRRATVLVTGATGFVGIHIVAELLRSTTNHVACLVRSDGATQPMDRLRRAMTRYALWREEDQARLSVVEGDLSTPRLGLDAGVFDALADSVDEIFHAAADVDWIQSYEALRPVNVAGTTEIIRLACTRGSRPLHFVSSLGVCYADLPLPPADESDIPLNGLHGLRLGYAQSKCVGESLIAEAQSRGLSGSIIRPALVTVSSKSAIANEDDLVTRFIAGCIALGVAPDLDWTMDLVPADHLARAVVAGRWTTGSGVLHVANGKGRRWLECVLWMRLRGYPVDVVSYEEWCRQLRTVQGNHPLHALRSFFLTVASPDGRTMPQLYENGRRRRDDSSRSERRLRDTGIECPRIDGGLLGRYFDDLVSRGVLPEPLRKRDSAHRGDAADAHSVAEAIARATGHHHSLVQDVRPVGGDSSIVAELTSWRNGSKAGLYSAVVGEGPAPRPLIIKVKPRDTEAIEIGEEIAGMCSTALGDEYRRNSHCLGFERGHLRELALYRCAPPAAREYMPGLAGTSVDERRGEWTIAIDRITDATTADAWGRPWTQQETATALRDMAALHDAWRPMVPWLSEQAWMPTERTTALSVAMSGLWRHLADNARPLMEDVGGRDLARRHADLASDPAAWRHPLDRQRRTLIHNDFNSRNLMLRPSAAGSRLVAFDWELATIGAPQRDAAELLCFVLAPDAGDAEVQGWLSGLAADGGDRIEWLRGYRAAHNEFLVDRIGMYAMLDRVQPQRFLRRVVQAWARIDEALRGIDI